MANKQYMDFENLVLYDSLIKAFVNGKLFVGTYSEYQTAYNNNEIAIGAIVVITDDENNSGSGGSGTDSDNTTSTSAVLGEAILGYMVLG